MINVPTKFGVPNFTGHGNMKGVAKCKQEALLLQRNRATRYVSRNIMAVF